MVTLTLPLKIASPPPPDSDAEMFASINPYGNIIEYKYGPDLRYQRKCAQDMFSNGFYFNQHKVALS